MLWIMQTNLFSEIGYVKFIEVLNNLKLDLVVIKPIPFTNKFVSEDFDSMNQDVNNAIEPFIDNNRKIIVIGSTILTRIAKVRKWLPGSYLTDKFEFEKWRDGFGHENILNNESIICKIHEEIDINDMSDYLFIRPSDDSKSFAGMIMNKNEFLNWIQPIRKISEEEFQLLHKNTKIIIANYKKINSEYRLFIVDNKIVTSSLYKQNNILHISDIVDNKIIQFVKKMINKWQPAPAFVIDIADTDKGLKIIEINNINSAGFYAADCQKIIESIEQYEK